MDQYKRELGNVNRDTNTLAGEVEKLLKKLDDPKKAAEVKQGLQTLKGKLEGMAAHYEPDPEAADPTDRNVTGKNEGDIQREKEESERIEKERKEKDERNTEGSEPSSLLKNKTQFTGPHGSTEPPIPSVPTPPDVFPDPPASASATTETKAPASNPFDPPKPAPAPWEKPASEPGPVTVDKVDPFTK